MTQFSPTYWLDEMDSCDEHGVAAMRHNMDGSPRLLENWACSQCGFKPTDIDWFAAKMGGSDDAV